MLRSLWKPKDTCIWTDPWLFGKAFNDSWSLLPAQFEANLYKRINYLWISHEHPDHFHIATLKSLPTVKERVTLLFQENNSDMKVISLGYSERRGSESLYVYKTPTPSPLETRRSAPSPAR